MCLVATNRPIQRFAVNADLLDVCTPPNKVFDQFTIIVVGSNVQSSDIPVGRGVEGIRQFFHKILVQLKVSMLDSCQKRSVLLSILHVN